MVINLKDEKERRKRKKGLWRRSRKRSPGGQRSRSHISRSDSCSP